MKIFDFLKKHKDVPEQIIRRQFDYMPDFYKTHDTYKSGADFVERSKFEAALKSLIQLADETGHYFSEDFWQGLAKAAGIMKMNKERDHSLAQILRNQRDIKFKTSFGWTTEKIDENHFQHHISEKLKEEWAVKRREKDGVLNLINDEGLHLKELNRSGYIYYVKKGRIAELEYELGVNGIILYYGSVECWVLLKKEVMTSEEKGQLKKELMEWSKVKGHAIEFA